jgi:citrate lyase subunit alpha/citrate CoA-transferase
VDVQHAHKVVAVTDNLVPFLTAGRHSADGRFRRPGGEPGDLKKIVSSTTRITTDPIGLQIAK